MGTPTPAVTASSPGRYSGGLEPRLPYYEQREQVCVQDMAAIRGGSQISSEIWWHAVIKYLRYRFFRSTT